MKRVMILILALTLFAGGCSRIKQLSFFGKKKKGEQLVIRDIEKLRLEYQDGNVQVLEELIGIYLDSNQPIDVRMSAGRTLADTQHPNALNAIADVVKTADALDITFMNASIDLLAEFRENPKAADAMISAMHQVEEKSNELHISLIKNLNRVRTKDQLIALLDLYEVARTNLTRTETLLTETLGALGTREVVPVLVSISKDPEVNINIRNRALEILGKKDPSEVVGAFTELLGNPETNLEVREFAINTMAGVKEERLILTLLDTYNTGKKQYYSLLNALIDALGEFDDPEVKKTMVEIAIGKDYPYLLRKKSIENLNNFNDPDVIPPLMNLLNDRENYIYAESIIKLVNEMGTTDQYLEEIRRLAFAAEMGGNDD